MFTYHTISLFANQRQVVSEKWSDDKVEITLQQDRFLSDGSESSAEEAGALWSIPLLFASSGT